MMHNKLKVKGSLINRHEVEFIKSFVIPQKQQRFLEFVNSEKGRRKFTSELDHPNFISSEFICEISPSQETVESISKILRNKHAPPICYVISSNGTIDSCELPIDVALEETIGRGSGTVLSFLPGRLAFFENEDGDMRFILKR